MSGQWDHPFHASHPAQSAASSWRGPATRPSAPSNTVRPTQVRCSRQWRYWICSVTCLCARRVSAEPAFGRFCVFGCIRGLVPSVVYLLYTSDVLLVSVFMRSVGCLTYGGTGLTWITSVGKPACVSAYPRFYEYVVPVRCHVRVKRVVSLRCAAGIHQPASLVNEALSLTTAAPSASPVKTLAGSVRLPSPVVACPVAQWSV